MDALLSHLFILAEASAASEVMRAYILPVMKGLGGLASVAVVFFLIYGGYHYITSTGSPDKLEEAKKIIKRALIGLVIVLAAVIITGILSSAYSTSGPSPAEHIPEITSVETPSNGNAFTELLTKSIAGFFRKIVELAAWPFVNALEYFTRSTPLAAQNPAVFRMWLAALAIADSIFILIVGLMGFHVMGASTFGLDEVEFKHLLPQFGAIFLLMNMSIFAIDGIIGLSNVMITALLAAFPDTTIWTALQDMAGSSAQLGLVALLILVAFMILSVVLLVYYISRIVVLYAGAVLSPFVVMLWLIPAFKDFAESAIKVYLSVIFVLFVHVVILLLASSLIVGTIDISAEAAGDTAVDRLTTLLIGIATVWTMIRAQSVMSHLSYTSMGPRGMRMLGGKFIQGMSYVTTVAGASIYNKVVQQSSSEGEADENNDSSSSDHDD